MKRDAQTLLDRPRPWTAWRPAPALAAGLVVLAILAIYADTALSIVAIWIRSETYAHGFLVVPICLWLAWRKRDQLAQIPAAPWWPGAAIVAGLGAVWLVASTADVLGVKQFALAFIIIAAIITVVGTRVARVLVFPLAFLLFAVPAGEIFVPTLIDWTADFTVTALRASGVPIYREANHFIIPSGAWSVVDACSGIRYLIASVMVGTIYAALAYRSARRRAMFIVASILVPIVANWLRAYMIVMIGHLSNNRLAVGVDHLIYGWVFFGVVMLLLFWVGSFWQEPQSPPVVADALRAPDAAHAAPSRAVYAAAVAAVVAAGVWHPIAAGLAQPSATPTVPVLSSIAGAGGWTASTGGVTSWRPYYKGFATDLHQTFRDGNREVGLYIAYYRHQEKGRELITSGNLLTARDDWNWKLVAEGREPIEWSGRSVEAQRAELLGAMRLDVVPLYWVDGRMTSNAYVAKALHAWSRLTGRGDDAALVVIYAPMRAPVDDSRDVLQRFARAMSPAIDRALQRARENGK